MKRAYYSSIIYDFCKQAPDQVLGEIAREHSFDLTAFQRDAWIEQTSLLRDILLDYKGKIYFEFSIPRMGRRIDAVVIIGSAVFVIEFKVGADAYEAADLDQVMIMRWICTTFMKVVTMPRSYPFWRQPKRRQLTVN